MKKEKERKKQKKTFRFEEIITSEDKLRKCPFCGGDLVSYQYDVMMKGDPNCESCKVYFRPYSIIGYQSIPYLLQRLLIRFRVEKKLSTAEILHSLRGRSKKKSVWKNILTFISIVPTTK